MWSSVRYRLLKPLMAVCNSKSRPAQTSLAYGCLGVCLFEERGELFLSWRRKGQKDEEAGLCANCDTSYPVPRSTRRT
jgi:hypothetical protein